LEWSGVVSEWYQSGIGVESEECKEVGEWSDVESRCSRSGMYLVGVYGMINMMCRGSRVQDLFDAVLDITFKPKQHVSLYYQGFSISLTHELYRRRPCTTAKRVVPTS
jgi:hypothetical protein